ncbi:hypothetical protein [Pseudomonas putida]
MSEVASLPKCADRLGFSEKSFDEARRQKYCLQTFVQGDLPAASDILVCLTLYNESAAALRASLSGLCENALKLRGGSVASARKIVVCIVLDGEASLDHSTLVYLAALGLKIERGGEEQQCGKNRLNLSVINLPISRFLPDYKGVNHFACFWRARSIMQES